MNRNDTKMIQGLSVLALVCLHLFNRWDYQGLFTPVLFIKNIPFSFYLSQLSDFCVMGFAFCSGYGHYKSFKSSNYYKKSLIRLFLLYINFWIILLLFTLISVIIGKSDFMPGNVMIFVKCFLTGYPSYNGAWWYLPIYACLVLLSPLILKFSEKIKTPFLVLIITSLYCLSYLSYHKWNINGPEIGRIISFLIALSEYMLGVICCKSEFFEKMKKVLSNFNVWFIYLVSAVIFIGMLLVRTLIVPTLAAAPVSGFVIICIFYIIKKPEFIEKFFMFIGEHSTNIWLVHMFFYSVLFKDLVYKAKYPLLIYTFMIVLCLATSYVIKFIHNPIKKQIQKLF